MTRFYVREGEALRVFYMVGEMVKSVYEWPADWLASLKEAREVDQSKDGASFSELDHLERGYCCGNGCRHCPFLRK